MKGTTRNHDPFRYGTPGTRDGVVDDMWYKLFLDNNGYSDNGKKSHQKDISGRTRFKGNRISEPIIQKAIKYLQKNGEIPSLELAHLTGMESSKIKSALTYRCRIYESDDGRYVGILDDNGDPVPTNHSRKYIINMQTYDVYAFGTVRRFKSLTEIAAYLSISRETAIKYYKTGKTRLSKLSGVIIKGVKN